MRRRILLALIAAVWLTSGCASYESLQSQEDQEMALENARRSCYSCYGPHSPQCEDMFLRGRGGRGWSCSGGSI